MNQKTKEFKNLFEYYSFTKKDKKEYPVISGILESLTPERMEKENEEVKKVKLPLEIQKWVKKYEKVGERDKYIWKWLYKMNEVSPFFQVSKVYFSSLVEVKTLFNMFIILVDDISEKSKEDLLKELFKIPFEARCIQLKHFSLADRKYLEFVLSLWKEIKERIQLFPRYKEYQRLFDYDTQQFLNEARYAYLIFKAPIFMNELEYWTYFPQGMQIIIDFDLDLMCSERTLKVSGLEREIVLILQKMARIGNWLSTWEREAKQGDFTGGIFPYAISHRIINPEDLYNKEVNEIINTIRDSGVEKYFLKKWEEYSKIVKYSQGRAKAVDFRKVLNNFEYLFVMHLISRGYK